MKKLLAILVFSTLCIGCKDKNDLTQKAILYFDKEEIVFDSQVKYCVIIPNGGCAGCIASGLSYIVANKTYFSSEQNENVIIFTGVNSVKLLKRGLKGDDLSLYNHILDKGRKYTIDGPENKYPLVLFLNSGKITKAYAESPSSNAFAELDKKLKLKE